MKWMPWCKPDYAPSDAEAWCARQAANFVERKEFDFAITSETDPFLGACGLNAIEPMNRRANLGYWTRASARGRQIASRRRGNWFDGPSKIRTSSASRW